MATAQNLIPGGPATTRLSLAADNFGLIEKALERVGHVVLENCFSERDIAEIREFARWQFDRHDEMRDSGDLPKEALSGYFSGMHDLDVRNNALLIEMVQRSRLPKLMTYLCGGPAMMFLDERALRRADVRFPLRCVGFHVDEQLSVFSDRLHTVWMPLTELGPDVYGFALFDKDFDKTLVLPELMLHSIQEYDEPEEASARRVAELMECSRALYAEHQRRIYVPMLEIGDIVVFTDRVLHGTQINQNATRQRLSLDFRWSAPFDWKANQAFTGRKAVMFDPGEEMSMTFVPPEAEVELFETANQARARIEDLRSEIATFHGRLQGYEAIRHSAVWRMMSRAAWLKRLATRVLR